MFIQYNRQVHEHLTSVELEDFWLALPPLADVAHVSVRTGVSYIWIN